jgi:flagellar motor switch protein FliG
MPIDIDNLTGLKNKKAKLLASLGEKDAIEIHDVREPARPKRIVALISIALLDKLKEKGILK